MNARTSTPDPVADSGHHEHDLGLTHDLPTLLNRRRALALFGGVGIAVLTGCADQAPTSAPATSAPTSAAATTAAAGATIPEETAGPFPGDGSNGVNVLTESGIVRSDIRSSFGGPTGVAAGVPLTVNLTVLSTANGSTPLSGAALYLWHCDQEGRYSLYSQGVEQENYLRGVQETNISGQVSFTTIYPAAYDGRWPHMHFEIYPSLAAATSAGSKLRTTQLALPEDVSKAVYATSGYTGSLDNLSRTSLDTDMVFRDGYSLQLATVSGDVNSGLTATLTVPV